MSLVKPPKLVEDPDWERAVLGPFVEDARARGDLYLEVSLASLSGHVPWLLADDPERAQSHVEHAEERWPHADVVRRPRR